MAVAIQFPPAKGSRECSSTTYVFSQAGLLWAVEHRLQISKLGSRSPGGDANCASDAGPGESMATVF
jgi:hypothetical protein